MKYRLPALSYGVGVSRKPGKVVLIPAAWGALIAGLALLGGESKRLDLVSGASIARAAERPSPSAAAQTTGGTAMPGPTTSPDGVTTSSTFNSISLSWRLPGGAPGTAVLVRFRPQGSVAWRSGLPLVYDGRSDRPYGGEYRGSLVGLTPGTTYDVQLQLGESGRQVALTRSTWSARLPVARTVRVPASTRPLRITEGGGPDGYVLYTPATNSSGIAVSTSELNAVSVEASYVVVRGFQLRGGRDGLRVAAGEHDVVIEENDISGWGHIAPDAGRRPDGAPYTAPSAWFWGDDGDAAIACHGGPGPESIDRVVVQGNQLHDPATGSNSWNEPRAGSPDGHPFGPQAIYANDCGANWVIRRNDIYSGAEHYFNDAIGGGANFSERGFPLADSDIAENRISNAHDDAIEAEGANDNVRIWGNYIDQTFTKIAIATTQIGPIYIWRNVADRSAQEGTGPSDEALRGPFVKAGSRDARFPGGGRIYVFNNTVLQRPSAAGQRFGLGPSYGIPESGGPVLNLISRNNILLVPSRQNYSILHETPPADDGDTSFDYDLYNGVAYVKGVERVEPHGIPQAPVFSGGAGAFTLAANSPGVDKGERIPNFTDGFRGAGQRSARRSRARRRWSSVRPRGLPDARLMHPTPWLSHSRPTGLRDCRRSDPLRPVPDPVDGHQSLHQPAPASSDRISPKRCSTTACGHRDRRVHAVLRTRAQWATRRARWCAVTPAGAVIDEGWTPADEDGLARAGRPLGPRGAGVHGDDERRRVGSRAAAGRRLDGADRGRAQGQGGRVAGGEDRQARRPGPGRARAARPRAAGVCRDVRRP